MSPGMLRRDTSHRFIIILKQNIVVLSYFYNPVHVILLACIKIWHFYSLLPMVSFFPRHNVEHIKQTNTTPCLKNTRPLRFFRITLPKQASCETFLAEKIKRLLPTSSA